MQKRRVVDLLLILTGGAIALISYFYLDGPLRWLLTLLGCGMLLLFLMLAVNEKPSVPLRASAPIFRAPPAAKVTEVLLLNEEDQNAGYLVPVWKGLHGDRQRRRRKPG